MKRICASKKILIVSYAFTILLTTACVLVLLLTDESIMELATLAGLAWGETAVANAFYYRKAQAENRIKLTKGMIQSMGDKYGIDAIARLAEVIMRE